MCDFDNPDCFHCPYEDCTASLEDIKRQWRLTNGLRSMDNPDCIPEKVKPKIKKTPEQIEKDRAAIKKYYESEKGKAKLKEYNQSEKGKERRRRYAQSEKGKATKRRYYLKKKLEREAMVEVKDA